ncbi:MAG: hypothetical protein SV186_00605 [Candidatus Nanohaloarchaea archaeon]|nr:hypothetical protein [Candidatus Nanohaloarchaea archaeon]
MESIELEDLGDLLDGDMDPGERVLFDGRIKVIGDRGSDLRFQYDGEIEIAHERIGGYDFTSQHDYFLDGDDVLYPITTEESGATYRDSKPVSPHSKGCSERLTVELDEPDARLIIEDYDRIAY